MNEEMLDSLREQPSEAFAAALRGRLRAGDATVHRMRSLGMVAKPALAVAVAAAVLSIPSVRASAQSFLSLFRLRTFLGVPVNDVRMREIATRLELGTLLGGQVEVIRAPGPGVVTPTLERASAEAGFAVRTPAALSDRATALRTVVTGPSVVKVRADSTLLAQVMEALGIDDLSPPAGLDGHVVNIAISPVVHATYEVGDTRARIDFVQALVPDVQLPPGVDIAALGEIALRILGLQRRDAHEMAQAIDWHTTLLVPIPPMARSFRQVEVGRASGLLVEKGDPSLSESLLLWSTAGRAYAMSGRVAGEQLVVLASSVQ